MSDSPLGRSPRLSHKNIMEHAKAIHNELKNDPDVFTIEYGKIILFKKAYDTMLKNVYEFVVMHPYNKTERLSSNNENPIPPSQEKLLEQIKAVFMAYFRLFNNAFIPTIKDKWLKFTLKNGKQIIGKYYESRIDFPEIVPNNDPKLPIMITGLEFGINVEERLTGKNRIFDSYRNTKYVKRSIPMHEINTIEIISEGGKRRTRKTKRSKRSKRSNRTRRHK